MKCPFLFIDLRDLAETWWINASWIRVFEKLVSNNLCAWTLPSFV